MQVHACLKVAVDVSRHQMLCSIKSDACGMHGDSAADPSTPCTDLLTSPKYRQHRHHHQQVTDN